MDLRKGVDVKKHISKNKWNKTAKHKIFDCDSHTMFTAPPK